MSNGTFQEQQTYGIVRIRMRDGQQCARYRTILARASSGARAQLMRRPVRTKLSSASPAAMLARRRLNLLLAALLPSTTHAAPLCNRSLPVCVVRDNVTVNYADACSDGTYVDNPPSCSWNSSNQSLVIAANVTVRCDRPSNSGCDKASDPRVNCPS